MSYLKYEVRIEKEDMRQYISQFCDEDDLENMDLENEGRETLNSILQDSFSDFCVIGQDTLLIGDWE